MGSDAWHALIAGLALVVFYGGAWLVWLWWSERWYERNGRD